MQVSQERTNANDHCLCAGDGWIEQIGAKGSYLFPRADWDAMMNESFITETVSGISEGRTRATSVEDSKAYYQDAKEEMPHNAPKPQGQRVGSD